MSRPSEWKNLRLRREDRVAVVELDASTPLNLLSLEVLDELTEVAQLLHDDVGTQTVVLTSKKRLFSGGADVSEELPSELLELRRLLRKGPRMCQAWENLEQLTIVAIEGACVGGATALALSCDLRIAAKGATLQIPEVAAGMNMSWQALPRLTRLVGPARAKRFAIFCEPVAAVEAKSWGLVDEVVDDGRALETALQWSDKVRRLPPIPVRMTKEAINATANALNHATAFMDRDQFLLTAKTEDFQEGIRAFLEKRTPEFKGR